MTTNQAADVTEEATAVSAATTVLKVLTAATRKIQLLTRPQPLPQPIEHHLRRPVRLHTIQQAWAFKTLAIPQFVGWKRKNLPQKREAIN
uniref:Uncharacterized protein n=1 Tax=Ciona intestinalis TaxID=7719 RepID=H2Y036_CIOIN